MIFITGDTHGGIDIEKLSYRNWPESKNLTESDYLIICGDFGLPFLPSDTWDDDAYIPNKHARNARNTYKYWIKWLSERPYTVLWCDGNHDNHPFWHQQEDIMWNGGMVNVHPEAENVLHLKRGEYYTIDGKSFWVMGGAQSHDRSYRIEGFSWWSEEIPSMEEMNHGLDTLANHGNKVDYIISHTLPQSKLETVLDVYYDPEPTRSYFDVICQNIDFKQWFCGHFHVNTKRGEFQVLYNDIVQL